MQVGSFDSLASVQPFTSTVLINGTPREHVSWSIDREISGDLPPQVIAGSGITQASGSITWPAPQAAEGKPASPWYSRGFWRPRSGDTVQIFAGDGATEWVQFTGIIDKASGDIGSGSTSAIIDNYDKFSATVSHEPMLAIMHPLSPGGTRRGVGLTHSYFVDLAFRAAGFFVTPRQEPNSVFHVPAQGSIWPHHGTCLTAGVREGSANYPTNSYAEWGFAVSNAQATYSPGGETRTADDPVQMTMVVGEAHAGFAYMRVAYGSTYLQLSVNASRGASIQVAGSAVTSIVLPPGDDIVQVLVKGYTFTIKSRSGLSASAVRTFGGSTPLGTITVGADPTARVAGLQVSCPTATQEFGAIAFQPNARINVSNVSMMGILQASPPLRRVSAADLLGEISAATLSGLWIDEKGKAQWWPALAFRNRGSSATLTTKDHVLALGWEDSVLGSRSRVSIKHKQPSLKVSLWQNVRLWEGSGSTMESAETGEEIIEPGPDEAWFGVDDAPIRLGSSNWASFNRPRRSFVGGYFSSDGATTSDAGLSLTISMVKRDINKWKMTHTTGALPPDVVANLSTSPTSAALWESNRNKPLPSIGGHGKSVWEDVTYNPPQVGGIGPELVHETGVWVPEPVIANVFGYLAGATSIPLPSVTRLDVAPDPRRQLGDVITIVSPDYLDVTLTALVVGVDSSFDAGGFTQALSLRVISADVASMTFVDFQKAIPGTSLTFAQWQSLGPIPQTFTAFNATA